MDSNEMIVHKYRKGTAEIFPTQNLVKNWLFDETEEEEAILASAVSMVAEKNGMSVNDMMHVFPFILRMLKSDSNWAK